MSPTQFSSLQQATIEGSTTSMTATTDPPATKRGAAKSADQTGGGDSTTAKKVNPRDYRITKALRLDLTDPVSLVEQLKSVAGGDDDKPEPVVVYVPVGTGKGINPDSALKSFGADNDMSGDYEVVSETSVKSFKDVSTEVKRQVSFS